MSSIALKDFVYPEPRSLEGLVSVNKAKSNLQLLPEQRRQMFIHNSLPSALGHLDADINQAVRRISETSEQGKLTMATLGAFMSRKIAGFVLAPCRTLAFEIDPDFWGAETGQTVNPVLTVCAGFFAVTTCLRPRAALDGSLAGNSVLINEDKLHRIVGSSVDLMWFAKSVLTKYTGSYPEYPMVKEDFRAEMRDLLPFKVGDAELDRVRLKVKPEWKGRKGGRPPGRIQARRKPQ